jgi:hypothetical protein
MRERLRSPGLRCRRRCEEEVRRGAGGVCAACSAAFAAARSRYCQTNVLVANSSRTLGDAKAPTHYRRNRLAADRRCADGERRYVLR